LVVSTAFSCKAVLKQDPIPQNKQRTYITYSKTYLKQVLIYSPCECHLLVAWYRRCSVKTRLCRSKPFYSYRKALRIDLYRSLPHSRRRTTVAPAAHLPNSRSSDSLPIK
jgi:hypothetical protein